MAYLDKTNLKREDLMVGDVLVPSWCVLSAVDHALGRSSYVTNLTADLVKQVWRDLEPGTRETIRRRVREYTIGPDNCWRKPANPVDNMDLVVWRDLWTWMEEN